MILPAIILPPCNWRSRQELASPARFGFAFWIAATAPWRCTRNLRVRSAALCLLSYGSMNEVGGNRRTCSPCLREAHSVFETAPARWSGSTSMNERLVALAGVAPARSESKSDALLLSYRAE